MTTTRSRDWVLSEREVRWGGIRLDLTSRQVLVLHYLARRAPARIYSQELNRKTVVPGTRMPQTSAVEALMVRLKQRLGQRNVPCPYIIQRGYHGINYQWVPE